ncbi:hypothetical protein MBLNU13_g08949t1 [Cladosporium sp. NU13]
MLTEDEFYEKWRKFFHKYKYQGKMQYPDEDENDKVALIVIDDISIEVIKDLPMCNKRYFVVLKREIFEKQGKVIICKAFDGEMEPQAILYKVEELVVWITSYNRHCWEQDYENYEERYQQ